MLVGDLSIVSFVRLSCRLVAYSSLLFAGVNVVIVVTRFCVVCHRVIGDTDSNEVYGKGMLKV